MEGSKLGISIQLSLPNSETTSREAAHKKHSCMSLEDKVRDMIELVDSGYDSAVEFIMLKKLYSSLCKKKQSPRVQNLKKMIEPTLNKYGYHVGK